MQGTPNAERLMSRAQEFFKINKENYNKAYGILMKMPRVFANEIEELKFMDQEFSKVGIKIIPEKWGAA